MKSETAKRLTVRQRQIFQLLVNGSSTKQIASRLQISPKTVAPHISEARRRPGARTRDEAIARAIVAGYVQIIFIIPMAPAGDTVI